MIKQGLIAKKIGMTRVIDPDGRMVPVTLLQVEEQKVTKVLSVERDGYVGLQVGYCVKPERKINKPDLARLRKAGVEDNFTKFKEFRLSEMNEEIKVGKLFDAALLSGVNTVDITGITKGKGFEGVIRRYNYSTGRRTHGSHFHRRPGSLGQRTTPGRVYKNKNMPGHMGSVQRTIQNLKVLDVDVDANVIAVKGSVPGSKNSFVYVKPSIKAVTIEKK